MARETPLRYIKPLSCEPPYDFDKIFTIVIMNDRKKYFCITIMLKNNAVNINMKSLSTNREEIY